MGTVASDLTRSSVMPGRSDSWGQESSLALNSITASILSQNPEGFAGAAEAVIRATIPDYSRIKSRTLIVAGAGDELTPGWYTEEIDKAIPGARVATVKDAGHWALLEDVFNTADVLMDFM